MTDTVDKVFFGGRDETLLREKDPHRNDDSSLALIWLECCAAEGEDRLYQQYRP